MSLSGDHDTTRIGRRALLGTTAAGFAVAATTGGAAHAGPGPLDPRTGLSKQLARGFRSPGPRTAAGFRWWWPNGLVDPAEITREVEQVAAAGFGTLEIADVTHSLKARGISLDLVDGGWGTPRWVAGVKAALAAGARRDVRIDITVGPSWPAAVSTITPDDDAACTELAHGRADVAAGTTYAGPVPEPVVAPSAGVTRRTLVAVQAAMVTGTDKNGTILDQASVVDLTAQVVDGALTWTAPAGTNGWIVLSYWQRGSAQEPEAGPHTSPTSYVVDHFSRAGSQAVIDLWNDRILDREMRSLLGRAGGYLFEDSLEIETDATIWTPLMLDEFRTRTGYDLLPYLPIVVEKDEKYLFSFEAVTTTRLRDDFNQVVSDLYRDHHLLVMQAFARGLGLGLRVQPYGLETDALAHSALLDVPESETLGFKNLDDYRVMAGGRDLAGHTVLSSEAACYNGAAYQTTWDRALTTINSAFAGGVNFAMLHGFAYADAPGVTWPGFAAFSPYYSNAIGYGEAWGPRMPTWRHVSDVSGYLNRTQWVLQSGRPRYDIVFLRQKGWTSTGIGAAWATNSGIPTGWTHSFATPALLDLPAAKVRGGRLAPDGPAYKVMIIGPDQFRGNERTIEVATATQVLALGKAGLPLVLHGDWSTVSTVGLPHPGEVDELQALIAQIAALPTTRTAPTDADIPVALAALGVTPDVQHESSTVMTVRRVVDDVDLYYVVNAKHAESRKLVRVTQDVWLTSADRRAVPVVLDAWAGTATPVAAWERQGARVRVSVDLQPGQSTVIALVPGRRGPAARSVVASTAPVHATAKGDVVLRASAAGRFTTTWSDGRTSTTTVRRVREPLALAAWDLAVEDWQPGSSATATIRPVRRVHLDALAPWSSVPGLEDVSGVGTYSTTVDLGKDWDGHDGAVLELGAVSDTFRVRVNGRALPPCDRLAPTVDLSGLLRKGRNVIEVEVASTLINRLRTVTPEVYGVAARAAYGLLGPVRLVPHVDTEVGTRV